MGVSFELGGPSPFEVAGVIPSQTGGFWGRSGLIVPVEVCGGEPDPSGRKLDRYKFGFGGARHWVCAPGQQVAQYGGRVWPARCVALDIDGVCRMVGDRAVDACDALRGGGAA